jgi:glutamate synthase domain-containing protein 2
MLIFAAILSGVLVLVAVYDLTQNRHAILRNFPLVGHLRYWLESVGPELRQYIVTNNDEERPFSRDQRSWIYASAKRENNYAGFGTDNDLEGTPQSFLIKHRTLAIPRATTDDPQHPLACAKILGGPRGRRLAFRPASVVNISAMSFGSLSAPAIEALNRGARLGGCLHNTGEGGISPYHRKGGDLVWQIGTGYFGARDEDGRLDLDLLQRTAAASPVRAIEIKLSQGAKPGLGGVLPKAKISAEIAAIRGIPRDRDCISPAGHSAFHDIDGLLDLVEEIAERTGLPVGIKSAVGELGFWHELANAMQSGERGVDFITIDGGEGGTGAAPPSFADNVALPFYVGFTSVYRIFAARGVADRVVWIGAGRLGLPERALLAFALGCDMINVAREAMISIGCIQAQRCHTGHCPTGVATQNSWLARGLDPDDKAPRFASYVCTLRKELERLSHAVGVEHPALVSADDFEMVDDRFGTRSAREVFHYEASWGRPAETDRERARSLPHGGDALAASPAESATGTRPRPGA